MEEFFLVDDDFCGNCSNSLSSTNVTSTNSSKIYNLDILIHTVQENKSLSVACEKVSVFTAIKDLLSCQFQISETDRVTPDGHSVNHCDNDNLNSTNKSNEHGAVNVQVPLCLPCSLLLQDLYRSFKLFQSLRDGTSYISKLTHRIQQTFPIIDVRQIIYTDVDHGIQCGEYENKKSEVQTFKDPFGEEINLKVNPSIPSPSATQGIVDPGPMENEILKPRNVQSGSLISVAIETNLKTEPEVETISENGFGLTVVEMQEQMIHSAISQIAAEEVGLSESELIDCEGNSSTASPSIHPATRTTSAFDPASSADPEFERENNKNDDDNYCNGYKLLRRRRPKRFRSKFNTKSKQRRHLKVSTTATAAPSISRSSSSYLSAIASSIFPLPDNLSQEDGNDSDEIQVVYDASSSSYQSNSNPQTNPGKEITIVNTYTVEESGCDPNEEEPNTSKNPTQITTTQPRKRVKCRYCNFESVKKSIVVHERLHTGEKPFGCPLTGCPFRAAHSTNVNKHMRTHLEENQFPCSVCPYRGKTFQHLISHQKFCHPQLFILP